MTAHRADENGGHALAAAIADDLDLLCRLHDREPDAPLLTELRSRPARDWFALDLQDADSDAALARIDRALAAMPDPVDAATLDALAVDYAELYLTFARRVAPDESFWLTEDHLARQEPMFSVRIWYVRHGLAAPNWRRRADDHLVHQLEFVAYLLRQDSSATLRDAGRFLDQHLMRWSRQFLLGAADVARTGFYQGLELLTDAYLQKARALIESLAGERRSIPSVDADAVARPGSQDRPVPFLPGAAPGW